MGKWNNPENIANLHKAAISTREQAVMAEKLASYQDEELLRELEQIEYENEKQQGGIVIGDGATNNNIIVNYAAQPNNGFTSRPMQAFGMNNGYYNPFTQQQRQPMYQDERLKVYNEHPGMKMYGLNPYAFYDASYLLDWYEHLENERKKQADLNYCLCKPMYELNPTKQMEAVLESLKFIPADEWFQHQAEYREKAIKEFNKAVLGFDDDDFDDEEDEPKSSITYNVYDANGYRFEKSCSFTVYNAETGEVVKRIERRKDETGQSYKICHIADDRHNQLLYQKYMMENGRRHMYYIKFAEAYNLNQMKYDKVWDKYNSGEISLGTAYMEVLNLTHNYERQEKIIRHTIATSSWSKKKFDEIMNDCCNMQLGWANKSNFFHISYDYERDMRYKELTSTEEELLTDPAVANRIMQEYELKRKLFMAKVDSDNFACDMAEDANKIMTIPKPDINSLTLEDFKKPENQIMYTGMVRPQLYMENAFIPKNISEVDFTKMTEDEVLNHLGINRDSNGNIIPQSREIIHTVVDDDTGQVISQDTQFFEGEELKKLCRKASDSMSNDELSEMF